MSDMWDEQLDMMPSIAEVIAAIGNDENAAYVRQMPEGMICEPREVWLPSISVWVREDGFSFNGDMGRGYIYPRMHDRLCIVGSIMIRNLPR